MANRARRDARISELILELVGAEPKSGAAELLLLRHYAKDACTELLEHVEHPDTLVRCRVAWILGHSRDPRAYEPLVQFLGDSSPDVRYDAAIALGVLGDPRAKPVLMALAARVGDEHNIDCAAGQGLKRLKHFDA